MPMRGDVSSVLQEFATSLGARDPKTVATYLTTMRDFVAWLDTQPGGTPFHLGLVTDGGAWVHGFSGHDEPRTTHPEQSPLSVAPLLPVVHG